MPIMFTPEAFAVKWAGGNESIQSLGCCMALNIDQFPKLIRRMRKCAGPARTNRPAHAGFVPSFRHSALCLRPANRLSQRWGGGRYSGGQHT